LKFWQAGNGAARKIDETAARMKTAEERRKADKDAQVARTNVLGATRKTEQEAAAMANKTKANAAAAAAAVAVALAATKKEQEASAGMFVAVCCCVRESSLSQCVGIVWVHA